MFPLVFPFIEFQRVNQLVWGEKLQIRQFKTTFVLSYGYYFLKGHKKTITPRNI